ncbi:hypothetical protein LOTGIDRAFT_230580 [Lottia gigantea]|uniref:Ig-like domain-containing protein n=1 Tax=Lottia gigantea TaxID=225164 RepID=V4ADV4_LOTGI|nr:hypothetical protein LOTGIDRAFT_230580 [Lottia gigantea]ESP02194.1 hypothetical protein LOTGIDRAFT_230580 [Lottia gigantea]
MVDMVPGRNIMGIMCLLLGIVPLLSLSSVMSDDTWNRLIIHHANITLPCDSDGTIPNSTAIQISWILPDAHLIQITQEMVKYQRYQFQQYGRSLKITDVDVDVFGIYHCMVDLQNGTILNFRHGINKDGPYFGDLMAKYKPHIVNGAIAAAIMFCVALFLCGFCSFQQERGQDKLVKFREENPGVYWAPPEPLKRSTYIYDNTAIDMVELKSSVKRVNDKEDVEDKLPPKVELYRSSKLQIKM